MFDRKRYEFKHAPPPEFKRIGQLVEETKSTTNLPVWIREKKCPLCDKRFTDHEELHHHLKKGCKVSQEKWREMLEEENKYNPSRR